MAQYEHELSPELVKILEDASLSPEMKSRIASLVQAEGTVSTVVDDAKGTDSTSTLIGAEKGATFGDGSGNPAVFENVEVAIIDEGASGDVNFTSKNGVTIDITSPEGLAVNVPNNANNNILWHDGRGSVMTGDGDDFMALEGAVTGQVTTGSGDLTLTLDKVAQEQAEISVDAGDGFDIMKLLGQTVDHSISFKAGDKGIHMHSADIQMTGVDVVATDVNRDNTITRDTDHIMVLATNEYDSLIAKLYKVALGREAIDDNDGWSKDGQGDTLGGLNWWMNEFEKQGDNDGSIDHLVKAFLNCDEFHNKYNGMTNVDYVRTLFQNLGLTDDDLQTNNELAAQLDSYVQSLDAGSITREDVAYEIASSSLTTSILGLDGSAYVIDCF